MIVPIAIGIIGKDWFNYLQLSGYEFVIRLRKLDYKESLATQMNIDIPTLDNKIRGHIASRGYFIQPFILKGKTFYYCVTWANGKKQDNDPYIRFISTKNNIKWTCYQYEKRWKIEVFFEDTKEKGFRLEQINFDKMEKIRLMVAVIGLCYALCIQQGIIAYEQKLPTKKLDKKQDKWYYRTSIFTKGYEEIEQIAFSISNLNKLIISFLKGKAKPNIKPFWGYIFQNINSF